MPTLKESFDAVLGSTVRAAREHYGQRLVSVIVFGSVGRGTQRADSDVDLLLVVRDLPSGRMRRVEDFAPVEAALAGELAGLGAAGIRTDLSPIFKTPDEVNQGGLIYLDMVDDARILHDPEGFFARFLAALRARLAELGSVRVRRGETWYWILKPDLKPGEVFELGPILT